MDVLTPDDDVQPILGLGSRPFRIGAMQVGRWGSSNAGTAGHPRFAARNVGVGFSLCNESRHFFTSPHPAP